MAYEGDKLQLLERSGKGNDDDVEDFSPLDETVKSHQDFDWETSKTSTSLDELKEILKESKKQQEELEMTPKTSTGRETLHPKKWGKAKTPQLKKIITNAMKTVEENFPNLNHSKLEEFIVNINEYGEITVKGVRTNAVPRTLFDDDGDMNESIPKVIKDILGEQISSKGLREQLADAKSRKKQYKKNMKKMEELAKTKDDELKRKGLDAKFREQMSDPRVYEGNNSNKRKAKSPDDARCLFVCLSVCLSRTDHT